MIFLTILSLSCYREKGYNVPQIPLDSLQTKMPLKYNINIVLRNWFLALCTFYRGAYLLNLKSQVEQHSNTEKLTPNIKTLLQYSTTLTFIPWDLFFSGSCSIVSINIFLE